MAQKHKQNQGLAKGKGRRTVDWQRIRADHNTGRYTDQELGELHGVARNSISRRRLKDNQADPSLWAVDKSAEVKRYTAALLVQQDVAQKVAAGGAASAVVEAALAARDVILRHRGDLTKARDTAIAMLEELAATTTKASDIEAFSALLSADLDDQAKAAWREQFKGFMRLHARSSSMHKLADSLIKLQNGERKAFGLDGDTKGQDQGKTLSDVDRAARLTAILDKARQAKQSQQVPAAPGQPQIPAGQVMPQAQATPPLH